MKLVLSALAALALFKSVDATSLDPRRDIDYTAVMNMFKATGKVSENGEVKFPPFPPNKPLPETKEGLEEYIESGTKEAETVRNDIRERLRVVDRFMRFMNAYKTGTENYVKIHEIYIEKAREALAKMTNSKNARKIVDFESLQKQRPSPPSLEELMSGRWKMNTKGVSDDEGY